LIPIGCASNSASAAACERSVANWVATTALGGRAFYVAPGQNADALTKLPGAVTRHQSGTPGGPLPPWARVGTARSVAPFVVEVHYQWLSDTGTGAGGRRRFLCLFGDVIGAGG
jgi:hypothetical protein